MSFGGRTLVDEVLETARARGLDQSHLARAAGIAPETLSRAKSRGNLELRTLTALAAAAGMKIVCTPAGAEDKSERDSLTDPRWGIAWSNPDMGREALVMNALVKGSYAVILEAAANHGIAFVKSRWERLKTDRTVSVSKTARASVERILGHIEEGFRRAST